VSTAVRTVRDASFEVLRTLGLTRIFGNPGSTEIPLLAGLPGDLSYVLALHEGAAVAMAAGQALVTGRPALVSLHTVAGLGNGVSAIATARANQVPLVVLVGQQDRRHLTSAPFLSGSTAGLAGTYPLATFEPPRPQDVPSVLAQAYWTAHTGRGPVLVAVSMDDWDAEAANTTTAAPRELRRLGAAPANATALSELAAELHAAQAPVLIAGSGADDPGSWAALVALADRLDCPVWQEPFPSRAGFPQDNPRFAGFLSAGREQLREQLAPHDVVLVVGTAMLRQYHYESGPLVEPGTRVLVLTEDDAEAVRSSCDVAVVAAIAGSCAYLAETIAQKSAADPALLGRADRDRNALRDGDRGRLRPQDVFAALADRIAADTVVIEETPSSRELLQLMLPARTNLGLLSAAMGGLGFALPVATGIRLADPRRPVVAVVGDGSATYCIQALWSAAHYGVGILAVILDNANYGVMNRLTRRRGRVPWPAFRELRLDVVAAGFGCSATRIGDRATLANALDEAVPALRTASQPMVIVIDVAEESTEPVSA
jgi:benzoylformate decarboxylase